MFWVFFFSVSQSFSLLLHSRGSQVYHTLPCYSWATAAQAAPALPTPPPLNQDVLLLCFH